MIKIKGKYRHERDYHEKNDKYHEHKHRDKYK